MENQRKAYPAEFLNRLLVTITIGEFIELLEELKKPAQPVINDFSGQTEKFVYGIAGIAKLFGCSLTTAQKIKSSGKIDKAITQLGKKIVVNAALALELAGKSK